MTVTLKIPLKHKQDQNEQVICHFITEDWKNTQIGHLDTNQFLSSIKTKNELTVYQKLESVMTSKPVDYDAVYKQTCLTNLQDLNPLLMNHNQEEADTSIVLHALMLHKETHLLIW